MSPIGSTKTPSPMKSKSKSRTDSPAAESTPSSQYHAWGPEYSERSDAPTPTTRRTSPAPKSTPATSPMERDTPSKSHGLREWREFTVPLRKKIRAEMPKINSYALKLQIKRAWAEHKASRETDSEARPSKKRKLQSDDQEGNEENNDDVQRDEEKDEGQTSE